MALNDLSKDVRRVVRWLMANTKTSVTREELQKSTGESVTAVTEALGYLMDRKELYVSLGPDPELVDGVPPLNSLTLYYRYTDCYDLFDRGVQAKRAKLFPPKKRRR